MELALEGANQMISELRIALSGAEGRANALDTQLARYVDLQFSSFSYQCQLILVSKERNVMLNIN